MLFWLWVLVVCIRLIRLPDRWSSAVRFSRGRAELVNKACWQEQIFAHPEVSCGGN